MIGIALVNGSHGNERRTSMTDRQFQIAIFGARRIGNVQARNVVDHNSRNDQGRAASKDKIVPFESITADNGHHYSYPVKQREMRNAERNPALH